MDFLGYRREDGTVGVRNHLLVIPTVSCADKAALKVADMVPGAVAIPHSYGCTYHEAEQDLIHSTLMGLGRNPNVGACLVVTLGCETTSGEKVAQSVAASGKPVELIRIQDEGGALKAAHKGAEWAARMVQHISREKRVEASLSDLMVAVECGGSDACSGISANPAVGWAADAIVRAGGTIVLSETEEIVGAEDLLAARATDEKVKADLLRIVSLAEESLKRVAPGAQGVFITPGNIEGGLTTIAEKSLGCIRKGGSSPLMEVVACAQRPTRKGLVVMDTSYYDAYSVTAKVAGGVSLVLFTTGRGTPLGNPIAPVIKVSSNTALFQRMADDIDLDAGTIVAGRESIAQVGSRILDLLLEVASGKETRAESWGWRYQEFGIGLASP